MRFFIIELTPSYYQAKFTNQLEVKSCYETACEHDSFKNEECRKHVALSISFDVLP